MTNEYVGLQKYKDKDGNINILYPVSKADAIELSDDAISAIGIEGDTVEDALLALNNKSSGVTSYNDLTDKPDIPADTSDLTNGAGYQTASDVAAALSNVGATFVSLTIPTTSWTAETNGEYEYYADITISGATANDSTNIYFDEDSLEVCAEAGVSSATNTSEGKCRIRSVDLPSGDLSGVYVVTKGASS